MNSSANDHPALLARLATGSMEALGEVYALHADEVYRLAYRLTGSYDDAGDVLQDVFIGLPRAIRSYSEQGRFSAWLRRLTVRTALIRMRSHTRRREEDLPEGVHDGSSRRSAIERLAFATALEKMPPRLRIVFSMKEIEGFSHQEIADLIDITIDASMARLSRAWKFLRKELA